MGSRGKRDGAHYSDSGSGKAKWYRNGGPRILLFMHVDILLKVVNTYSMAEAHLLLSLVQWNLWNPRQWFRLQRILHCAKVGSKAGARAAAQRSYMTGYNFDDLSRHCGSRRPRGSSYNSGVVHNFSGLRTHMLEHFDSLYSSCRKAWIRPQNWYIP